MTHTMKLTLHGDDTYQIEVGECNDRSTWIGATKNSKGQEVDWEHVVIAMSHSSEISSAEARRSLQRHVDSFRLRNKKADLEEYLETHCGSLCMDAWEDRAELAAAVLSWEKHYGRE